MSQVDSDNRKFFQAFAFVNQTNKSLFLTGKAGTGKTTFLKYVKEHSHKKMAIVAPTGVAAINAGGTTIHSFFQLPLGTFLPTSEAIWGDHTGQVYNKTQLLRNFRLRQAQRKLIQSLELLVIDEVSMVRADVLDAMDLVLRSVRRRSLEPFGGCQILFIGDLFQLPPVVRPAETEQMRQHYAGPFFFNAHVLKEVPLISIELDKVYRQRDGIFIDLLEKIRNNCCSDQDLEFLHRRYHPQASSQVEEGYITLTTHNRKADVINNRELDRLPGNAVTIFANVKKNFPENAYPAEERLCLKEGAQVMFIKNDKGENRRYFNGKIGRVHKIDNANKRIQVLCPNETEPIDVELEIWKNIRYEYDKENDRVREEELGSFEQYPLRLAWAVTIHKSQGLTFDKALIDAGHSFAAGQVYVALSRLRSLEGLILCSPISQQNILTDPRIVAFAQQRLGDEQMDELLYEEQLSYAKTLLFEAYDFETFTEEFREHSASYYEKAIPDRPAAFAWSESLLPAVYRQQTTARNFGHFLTRVFQQEELDYAFVHERNQAAVAWFVKELESELIVSIRKQIEAQRGKKRIKRYVVELQELLSTAEKKKEEIEKSLFLTEALWNNDDIQEAFRKLGAKKPATVTKAEIAEEIPVEAKVKGLSRKTSLALYKQGKTIDEIAAQRGMVRSTIEGHLVSFIPEGLVSIDDFVSPHKIEQIKLAIQQHPTATLSLIKEVLGDSFSYPEIRAVFALEQNSVS